jgi:hypothetical protein
LSFSRTGYDALEAVLKADSAARYLRNASDTASSLSAGRCCVVEGAATGRGRAATGCGVEGAATSVGVESSATGGGVEGAVTGDGVAGAATGGGVEGTGGRVEGATTGGGVEPSSSAKLLPDTMAKNSEVRALPNSMIANLPPTNKFEL